MSFVLDRIIRRLERQVQAEERVQRRELFVWSCPAGCGPQAADCGRLIFRRQCMPTADSIRRKQLSIWRSDLRDANDGDSGLLGIGGFRSIGGHSFLKKKQWELFCQQEQAASEFLPGVDDILTDSEVAEIQSDFLSLWDGKVQSGCGPLGRRGGPRGCPCGGEMGSHGPPQAPIFRSFFFLFSRFFTCFHGNSAYLRPCYHALRQPVGAADRAMMHN